MGKTPSFESLGVHPTLVSALRRVGIHPTPFQARVLANTTSDFADVMVDGRAAGGVNPSSNSGGAAGADGIASPRAVTAERHTLITIFVTHCLMCSREPSRSTAVVVASSKDCAAQLQKSMKAFASHCHVEFQMLTNEGQPTPPVIGLSGESGERGVPGSASVSTSKGGRVFITTLRVLRSWSREFLRSITTLAVEDASRNNERHLEDILRALAPSSPSGNAVSSNHSSNNLTASRQTANIFLMYLAPLTKVSFGIRYRLNRRNRRYYHLQGPSAPPGSVLQTASGTLPPSSTQLVQLLYLDERDREEILHRVLQMYHSRRIVILTHHKEIKHLHQTIAKWGMYQTGNEANGRVSDYMSCMLRSDTAERQESTLMGFLRDTRTNSNSGAGNSGDNGKSFSALLIGWDAFTAVDLMDVDVFIQYYPPQKSLTERERAEFVQVLHTTADPENSRRGRRTLLITFLAINDFTLALFFMQQYGQNGPILNIAPNHPEFQRCIMETKTVLRIKQKKEGSRRQKDREEGGQYPNASRSSSAGAANAPVPLPRSMRHSSPGARKEKEQRTTSGSNKGNATASTAVGSSSGGGGGGDGKSRGGGRWSGEGRGRRAGDAGTASGESSACVSSQPTATG
ncbi:hypothetical protein TcG_03559 [Trypanosoma cruzi]|uniref:RNA helicase n=2 Tax=Trypanosoma cruzi TaxID=5693 RepID=V5BJB5_TRYCR|nr:hypothetical protein TCDM_05235 [Trypanosoma cruzi Dm28c]KAF8275548.1 hypothetical protein TcBrA4_0137450 [Trypanosoma cruzi]PBJ79687.1 hypothetical protein BCY84_02416 [Trypanosoma cruzi cruzi]PWU97288.1 hypothetical protein C4B63_16g95 [Trypanosoma cruzi]RNF20634.1 hypothetical protein TcG_03559 [Trypanosoma cruzi]